jgi:hypothetical protein
VVWGQCPPVDQDFSENFEDFWSGTGTIIDTTATIDATCVDQVMILDCPPEVMESEPWYLGVGIAVIRINEYGSGVGTPYIEFRTGATKAACLASTYEPYDGISLISLGWVQIRVTNEI